MLAAVFRYTSAGLRLRATAFNADVARLLGVRVGRMLTLGWALAGLIGALAGVLVSPVDVPVPEQHGRDLRARLHRGGDRRAGQPGRARSPGGLILGVVLSYVGGYLRLRPGADVRRWPR